MTKLSLFLLVSALAAQTNYDLLLQGGRVIDPKNGIDARMDVAIANGKIARVAAAIPATEARKVVNVSGLLVTPGLIDIHVHVYQRPENTAQKGDTVRAADQDSSSSFCLVLAFTGNSPPTPNRPPRNRVVRTSTISHR
jgi:dihydroorotase